MARRKHPGTRLREFRIRHDIGLREAAKLLHVKHPALRDWEEAAQTPTAPYRRAIETWTNGEIRAGDWPLSAREREIISHANLVRPFVPACESGATLNDSETDAA